MSNTEKPLLKYQFERGQYDDDHIFDEELEMIQSLREALGELNKTWRPSDRFLLVFLIARKHDITRAEKLLRDHFEWRQKWGFNSFADSPRLLDVHEHLSKTGQHVQVENLEDKQGGRLIYKFSGKLIPSKIEDPVELAKFIIWNVEYAIEKDTLFHWRQGMTLVQDMAGFGMKNMSLKNSQHFKNVQDVMPFRPQKIYILNGGIILPMLLKVAKAFVKAKILRRIQSISSTQLADMIDVDHLLDTYEGGKYKYDHDAWFEAACKEEAEIRAEGAVSPRLSHKKKHKKKKSHKTKEEPEDEAVEAN